MQKIKKISLTAAEAQTEKSAAQAARSGQALLKSCADGRRIRHMRILFMGTAAFAAEALSELAASEHEVAAVVAQPDKASSRRGRKVVFSPVKVTAEANGLPLYQPQKAGDIAGELSGLGCDIAVVCAYGQLLDSRLLNMCRYGAVNIHASLLPLYRGAAPVHRALIDGQKETGVSIIRMNEKLDQGDVILYKKTQIEDTDNVSSLYERLAKIGSGALLEALCLIESGQAVYTKQDESLAGYAHKISREEREVSFFADARKTVNKIRGLDSFPGAYAVLDGRRIGLYGAVYYEYKNDPGAVSGLDGNVLLIGAEGGTVGIARVKPEGRREMTGREFYSGLSGSGVRFS